MATQIEPVEFQTGRRTWRVFGLRYPRPTYSKIVFDRALEAAAAREGHDLTVLNTLMQPDQEPWLLVIDASDDGWYLEGVDWWPGEPAPLDDRTVALVVQRRAAVGLAGQPVLKAHYGRGAFLRPNGEIDPVVGGDQ